MVTQPLGLGYSKSDVLRATGEFRRAGKRKNRRKIRENRRLRAIFRPCCPLQCANRRTFHSR